TRLASPSAWTFTFLINSNVVRTATAFGGSGPAISSIGIGMLAGGGRGYVKNFSLTATGSAAPAITQQPAGGTFTVSNTLSLTVAVSGTEPFHFQWQKNLTNLLNATNSAFTITNLAPSDAGDYRAIVTNSVGSTTSSVATVTVTAQSTSLLVLTTTFNSGNVQPGTPALSNDLLQTSLASVSPAASGNNFTGAFMRNGTTGTASENTAGLNPANIMNGGTCDFLLNTNAQPNGYDITSVVTYSGWTDDRAGQEHSIWYQVVGSSAFTLLTNVSVSASAGALRVAIGQAQGAIASGVKAIRVVLNQSYFVYRELDVIGTPTVVPPPSLQIARLNGDSVKVWWPASAAGYLLKSASVLNAGASWQFITNAPVLSNAIYQVILPIAATQFLRLEK
ncbi:MAG: hypothetical protein H7Y43_07810, partial [Akkermansiaceae bacterium]|nr:hypothetical protein [Verrucomicrobiales bacterium]